MRDLNQKKYSRRFSTESPLVSEFIRCTPACTTLACLPLGAVPSSGPEPRENEKRSNPRP
jgi:hypothetical protein